MTDWTSKAEDLAHRIENASAARRLALQPELELVLRRMQQGGEPVSPRLRNMEAELIDELTEARFDNVPV